MTNANLKGNQKGGRKTDKSNKESLKATLRDLNTPNENANYKNDVNGKHADMKLIFRTPVYVLKNAENDIFSLPPSHIAICEAITADRKKENQFIKAVRRSDNGETNMYFVRQLIYQIDKVGFKKAIEAAAAKLAANKETAAMRIAAAKLKAAQKSYDLSDAAAKLSRCNMMLKEKLTKAAKETYMAMRDAATIEAAASKEAAVLSDALSHFETLKAAAAKDTATA